MLGIISSGQKGGKNKRERLMQNEGERQKLRIEDITYRKCASWCGVVCSKFSSRMSFFKLCATAAAFVCVLFLFANVPYFPTSPMLLENIASYTVCFRCCCVQLASSLFQGQGYIFLSSVECHVMIIIVLVVMTAVAAARSYCLYRMCTDFSRVCG